MHTSGIMHQFLTPQHRNLRIWVWANKKKGTAPAQMSQNCAFYFFHTLRTDFSHGLGQVRISDFGIFFSTFQHQKGPAITRNLEILWKKIHKQKRQRTGDESGTLPQERIFRKALNFGRLVELTRQIFQSKGLSLNRSQYGSCSTKYDTPAGT